MQLRKERLIIKIHRVLSFQAPGVVLSLAPGDGKGSTLETRLT